MREKLITWKKFHLIPIYYLLKTSYLANEWMKHGGSAAFSRHLTRGKPKGKYLIGNIIDYIMLNSKPAQSFRERSSLAKRKLMHIISLQQKKSAILSVPCGYGCEILEIIEHMKKRSMEKEMPEWWMLDIDKKAIDSLPKEINSIVGNALVAENYPRKKMDCVLSLGLTEYLDDEKSIEFFKIVRKRMTDHGTFITSATAKDSLSSFLINNFSTVRFYYRNEKQLIKLVEKAGFEAVRTYQDKHKLLTFLICQN